MKILFLGDDASNSTTEHRFKAFKRLGHDVLLVNPLKPLPQSVKGPVCTRFGYGPMLGLTKYNLRSSTRNTRFDLCWIDTRGELSTSDYIYLKSLCDKIVSYNVDDPFGGRDGKKWDLYKQTLSFHDLTVVVREENIHEAINSCAKRVIRVFRSYDPFEHNQQPYSPDDENKWKSDVSFVGTWMPERGPFFLKLIKHGVPLTIRGQRWDKAPEWSVLSKAWKGPGVYGTDYVKAIQYSKISLGLLSKGNRDLHTQRSAEIPYIGTSVFCAERTSDHEAMFVDNEEALLWSSAEECADKCLDLLTKPDLLKTIPIKAKEKIISLKLSNDEVIASILKHIQ